MSKKHMTKKITAFIMAFAFVTSTNYTNMILALESTSEMESVPIVYSEAEVKINLNGITENKYNLLNEIFEDVNISEIGKKRAKILFESESSLEDHLKINTEDFFNYGEIEYHVDDIIFNKNKVTINITEYYDISNFKMDEVSIYCEEVVSENNKYPYHSKMKISPNKGWKLNNNDDIYFYLLGDLNSSVRYVGDKCYFEVINGSEKLTSFAEKTRYTLSFDENSEVKCVLNGEEKNSIEYNWIDKDVIEASFYVKDNSNIIITGMDIISERSGEIIHIPATDDGKYINFSISTFDIPDSFIDSTNYNCRLNTISNKINIPVFISDNELYYGDMSCNLYMIDGNCKIEIPTIIYENGVSTYVVKSFGINGELDNFIDIENLFNDGKLGENIIIDYNLFDNIILYYNKIIKENNNNYEISYNIIKNKENSIFVSRNMLSIDILSINDKIKKYYCSYDLLFDNALLRKYNQFTNLLRYSNTDLSDNKILTIKVTSILYLDSAGFHNIIPEPLYFYIDDHAPIISVSNTPTDTYDNEKWSSNVYSFDISVDDKEFFQASDNNEINETYQKINGVASDISKINIGEYTFEKTGAGWNRIDNENINDEYEINIYDIADGKIRADVFLKEGKDFFEGTLEVSAEDKCGNISDIQYASVRMDSSGPVVSYIKLENIRGMNGKIIGTDGKNISVLFKAGDNISGIRSAVLEYGNFSADMNNGIKVSNEGNGYLFEVNGVISQDTEDKIKLTLTDNAGNESIYYYSKNEPVKNYEEAIDVIIDTAPPVCKASVENANFEDNGKKWFRVCPDINIFLSDKKGNVCSGIDSINISINGGKTKTISWLNETENNDYNIVFRKSENYIYDAVLVYKSGMEYLIGSINTKDENGKIYADVSVSDFAGNISDTSHIEFYLDTDEPVVDEIFKIKENNDNVRNFGAFFNKSITLEADVSEYGPSSGLKNAILEFAGEKYEYEFYNDKTAEFVIPFETGSIYGEPVIEVFDNAGNSSGKCKLISEKGSSDIIIEDRNPDIHGPAAERPAEYIDNENNKWYNSNINLTYRFTDADSKNIMNSGIKITDISLNGKQIIAENFSSGEIRLQEKAYTVNTSEADNSDGKFVFNVKTEDNSGNKNNSEYTIYTDITAPEITAFSIAGVRTAPDSLVNGIFVYSYGYFFKNETAVTVYAEDKNSSSGLREIVFTLIDSKGNIFKQMTTAGENIKYANGEYYTSFVIPEGFKGIVSAYAIDNVENVSETLSPEGFILESPGRHTQTSFIDISLPETAYKDQNGLPLYDSDVKVIFNANDSFSGIKKAEWNFSEYSDDI